MSFKSVVKDIGIFVGIVLGCTSIGIGVLLSTNQMSKPLVEAYYHHLKLVNQLQQESVEITKKSHFLTPSQKDEILTVGIALSRYVNETDDAPVNLDFPHLRMLEEDYSRCLKEVKEFSAFVPSCSADHYIATIEEIKFPKDDSSYRERSDEEGGAEDEAHETSHEESHFSGHAAE